MIKRKLFQASITTTLIFALLFCPYGAIAAPLSSFDISSSGNTDPFDVMLGASGYTYVIDYTGAELYVYDDTNAFLASYDTAAAGASSPSSVTYNSVADDFYILNSGDDTIYVYEGNGTFANTTIDLSGVAEDAGWIAWDGTYFWLLDTFNVVYRLSSTGATTGLSFTLPVEVDFAVGISVGGGYLWVSDYDNAQVHRINLDGSYSGLSIDVVGSDGIAPDPIGLHYIEVSGDSYVGVIDYTDLEVSIYAVGGGGGGGDGEIVANGDDDAYFGTEAFSTIVPELLYHGNSGGVDYELALRFQNMNIAQGATITSATLQLYYYTGSTGTLGTLYGYDTDDAPVWGALVNPDSVSKTTASTALVATADAPPVPNEFDVTDIVQEIVNRPGWTSGNSLSIVGDATGVTAEEIVAFLSREGSISFVADTSLAPLLIVSATGGGGGDPPARELRLQGGVRLMNGVRLY